MKNKGCSLSLWTSNGKGQIERKFSKSKNLRKFDVLGPWRSGGMKSCDFYCKSIILAWMHVVWAILRQNRLGGLTSRGELEKKSEICSVHWRREQRAFHQFSESIFRNFRKSREAPIGMMCRRKYRACATAQPVITKIETYNLHGSIFRNILGVVSVSFYWSIQ